MTEPDSPVLLATDGGVATITLNRPRAYNAFDGTMKPLLLDVLRGVAADAAVRAVVITGAGKAFSAGQDLKDHLRNVQAGAAGNTVTDFFNPMLELVTGMAKPVIAAVNGVAAGAGAGLAFACDLRVVASSAVFRTSFAQVGLSADSALSLTLPRLIGAGRALQLTLLDQPLDAATALAWGAATAVADDDAVVAEATALAAQLAAGPTTAYGWIKASFAQAANGSLTDTLAFENRAQKACFGSADHHEALSAFVEKRPPVFTGR
ncbi:enoyl-CoA hydratase-related protein [Nakamurella lactea]|uniref:enoyl-CoA hydratase-related protein n=1 Tax=Nakamurella lactea TaxID=459515 RepID=UPI00041ED248|nr:enoyl-CoA hydratase-related protein [Nakamurella lactea]